MTLGIGVGRVVVCAAALLGATACIERTVTIETEPTGATVFLNDQDVGKAPVTVPFTWYGDYDIILRKDGYKTVRTHKRLHAPWYQWPGFDLVTECFVPFTVRDHHVLGPYALEPQEQPTKEELIDRAETMRAQAEQ